MPYDKLTDLPDYVQKLPDKKQRMWRDIFNSSYARCMKGKSGDDAQKTCETSAFKQASGVTGVGHANNSAAFSTADPVADVAHFELPSAPGPIYDDGETVYRAGLVFRAGNYEDKAFSMTPDELRAAVQDFAEPLSLDLEHIPSVLDHKIGQLVSVDCSEDGEELHGIVALPKWLDDILEERKLSATWDRATKRLAGLALVRNPRVSDAALMAAFSAANPVEFAEWDTAYVNDLPDSAFLYIEPGGKKDSDGKTTPRSKRKFPYKDASGKVDLPHLRNAIARIPQSDAPNKDALQKKARDLLDNANNSSDDALAESLEALFAATRHDTPQGRATIQAIHNVAANGGAVCKASNAKMASSHESTAIQRIHDMATEHGAACSAMGKGDGPVFPIFNRGKQRKETRMGWRKDVAAAFAAALGQIPEEDVETPNESPPPAAPPVTVGRQATTSAEMSDGERAELNALRNRATALEDENRRIRAEAILREATAFAEQMLQANKIYPAQFSAVVSGYVQSATDDLLRHDPVEFSIGPADQQTKQSGTRVDLFKAAFTSNTGHGLTVEQLIADNGQRLVVLSNPQNTSQKDGPPSREEVDKLLGMTATGRATLRERQNGGSR